jgi:hypothetical protein
MIPVQPVRRIVIAGPGRSGSTLLQSAFMSSCDVLTFFEPCRHGPSPQGDVRKDLCVAQLLRFLQCDLPRRADSWDPPEIKSWLRHPYNVANTSCAPPPLTSVFETANACLKARLLLVKEIRLVGQLFRLANALTRPSNGTGLSPQPLARNTAIIHLVRDPRPMLASQKRLRWWGFGDSRHLQLDEMRRVARETCDGMVADADTGDRLQRTGRIRYVFVRFEELDMDLEGTTNRVFTQLGLPVQPATKVWLNRTLQGHCAHGSASSKADKFEYSTCRAKTRRGAVRRWKHALSSKEKQTILSACAGALARFGYTDVI